MGYEQQNAGVVCVDVTGANAWMCTVSRVRVSVRSSIRMRRVALVAIGRDSYIRI